MINTLSRILPPLCLATAIAFGVVLPAQAQELKIGFLAPRTGIITQLGTDMTANSTIVIVTGLFPECPLWVKSRHCSKKSNVRFTPESGHLQCNGPCPLWANSGHRMPPDVT